jgi:hypothetical protein
VAPFDHDGHRRRTKRTGDDQRSRNHRASSTALNPGQRARLLLSFLFLHGAQTGSSHPSCRQKMRSPHLPHLGQVTASCRQNSLQFGRQVSSKICVARVFGTNDPRFHAKMARSRSSLELATALSLSLGDLSLVKGCPAEEWIACSLVVLLSEAFGRFNVLCAAIVKDSKRVLSYIPKNTSMEMDHSRLAIHELRLSRFPHSDVVEGLPSVKVRRGPAKISCAFSQTRDWKLTSQRISTIESPDENGKENQRPDGLDHLP